MPNHRRQFLRSAAAALAALPFANTASAAAALGKTGLKIVSIETFTQGTALSIVRVRADDGSEGYGQIAPSEADISALVLHRKVARLALGADPADVEALADRVLEENYKFPGTFICRALGGVDTALWDLLGRRAGKSVCELLGGKPRPLPVYGSSMSRTISPDDEAARMKRLRDEQGFRAFKIRVGKRCGHDQDQWPGRTPALVPTIRKALGEKIDLLADANSCYTPETAIAVGRLLEQHGYSHFEEPCPYWELEWTAEVAAALKIPVAGGEQDTDLAQWRRMFRMKAVRIAQPDVCYVGGLTRALRVAELARQAGLTCVPHSSNLSLVTVFTLHLFGAIANPGRHVEFSIETNPWADLFRPALQVRDGRAAIPVGPGWGVTINPAWLAKAQHQQSTLTK